MYSNLKLRRAVTDDVELYFKWVNDELVRENSINQEAVIWENHIVWYEKKIIDDNTKFFILEDITRPVGQIRIDWHKDNYWLINYSIDKHSRNLGYGKKIVELLLKEEPELNFLALVKQKNTSSNSIFVSNNFSKKSTKHIGGEVYNIFDYYNG